MLHGPCWYNGEIGSVDSKKTELRKALNDVMRRNLLNVIQYLKDVHNLPCIKISPLKTDKPWLTLLQINCSLHLIYVT